MYGVDCNYGASQATLQLSAQGSFQVEFVSPAPTEQIIDFGIDTTQARSDLHPSQPFPGLPNGGKPLYSDNITRLPRADGVIWSSQSQPVQAAAPGTSFWPASFLAPFSPVSINSTTANMIDSSLQFDFSATDMQPHSESAWAPSAFFWHFSEAHLEILARFRDRTALTIGDKNLAPAYRDLLCQLAMTVSLRLPPIL